MNTSHHLPAASATRQPELPPAAIDGDDAAPACGWFESSFVLRQGLTVSELPDSDGAVAALWFSALASSRLQ